MELNALYLENMNSLIHCFIKSQILQLTNSLTYMLLSLCLSGCGSTTTAGVWHHLYIGPKPELNGQSPLSLATDQTL